MEDALFAGALVERLGWQHPIRSLWEAAATPLETALSQTRNGRRLVELGLGADVSFCARVDSTAAVGTVAADGRILLR